MNSPITSPWSAVLTSSATITLTPYSAALARASSAPEISLWSVTAIAPRPSSRAVAEQHLDRRRAVVGVVGVHVQVDVDQAAGPSGACGQRASARPPARCAAGRASRRRPRRPPRRRDPSRASCASRRRLCAAACAASRLAAAGRAARRASRRRPARTAGRARPRRAAPRRPAAAPRPGWRPRPSRARARRGRGRLARRGEHRDVGRPSSVRGSRSSGPMNVTRSRSSRRSGVALPFRAARPDLRAPVEVQVQPPQRAQEQAQRAALLAVEEHDAGRAVRVAPGLDGIGPGHHDPVLGGEVALVSRSRVASKEAVRASRRPKNSSTTRRATWVESTRSAGAWNDPTFSAREWRSAALEPRSARTARGRGRSRAPARPAPPRSCARRRPAAGSPGASGRPEHLADAGSRRRVAVGSTRLRRHARLFERRRESLTSPGESDGAMTSTRWPRRASRCVTRSTKALTSCPASHA